MIIILKMSAKKRKINFSMKILDDFITECKRKFPNREIFVISAMGQVENKNIDEDYKDKNSVDYKITNVKKFLKFFQIDLVKTLKFYMK